MSSAVNYIPLRQIRGSCYDKLLMTLKAYFDDSGKLNDPVETVVIVGGFIATANEWDELEPEWWEVLKKHNIKEFHAVDFAQSRGDFLRWPENKRQTFLGELAAILSRCMRNPSKPIAALLPITEFNNLEIQEQVKWGSDPYFVCLEHCITLAAVHSINLYPSSGNVEIFCDEQPKFEGIANRVYRACQEKLPNGMGDRLSGFSFGKSEKWIGLQVADFVAYECLQLRRDMFAGKDNLVDKTRWPLNRLLAFNCEFEFYAAQHLWEISPLTDYSL